MKELKDLTFADDFMFTHILSTRKDICKGLLERLLHIDIDDIQYPEKEKTFKTGYAKLAVSMPQVAHMEVRFSEARITAR